MGRKHTDDEEFDDIDFERYEDEDEDTLKELDVDENGHLIEGRRKRWSREDEFEEDFDFEDRHPEAFGYEEEDD